MPLKLGVIIYPDVNRANEVLTGYEGLHPAEYWVSNVGIIERHRTGRISIYGDFYNTGDVEEGDEPALGLSAGGLTGLLVGALAGPAGMAAGGAVGASLGGLLGAASEADTNQSIYAVIRAKLSKNSSALVLLADAKYVDALLASASIGAREVYQQVVREELRGRLDDALREAMRNPAPQSYPMGQSWPSAH
jgi:uncharacterized membrane protein